MGSAPCPPGSPVLCSRLRSGYSPGNGSCAQSPAAPPGRAFRRWVVLHPAHAVILETAPVPGKLHRLGQVAVLDASLLAGFVAVIPADARPARPAVEQEVRGLHRLRPGDFKPG